LFLFLLNKNKQKSGHVRDIFEGQGQPKDRAPVRQYMTNEAIDYHCDGADVVALLCVQEGASGGLSRLVSSVAIFNEIFKANPDDAALLFEPQLLDTRGDGGVRYFNVSPLAYYDGVLSTFWHNEYFRTSHLYPGAPPPTQKQQKALDLVKNITTQTKYHVEMRFERGDIQFVSNHVLLHSRTAYEDGIAGQQRHLLRLWLTLEDPDDNISKRWYRFKAKLGVIVNNIHARIVKQKFS
jgi:hypothetical protein